MEKQHLNSGYKVQDPVIYAKHSSQRNKYFKDDSTELNILSTEATLISDLECKLFYWKTRCLLAEVCLEESPCDPDITYGQIRAYTVYKEFIKNSPEPK